MDPTLGLVLILLSYWGFSQQLTLVSTFLAPCLHLEALSRTSALLLIFSLTICPFILGPEHLHFGAVAHIS